MVYNLPGLETLNTRGQRNKVRQSSIIAINALSMWTARALQLFPQLYLVPYLVGKLGKSGYGIYALVWSLLFAVDTLQRSLQSGVVKYSAAFLAQRKIDEVNKTISSSFLFSSLLAIIISSALFFFILLNKNISPDLRSPLIIVSFLIILIVPVTPYIAVLQAKQYYYIGVITDTIFNYIGFFLIIIFFQISNPSINNLILIMGIMMILAKAIQIPLAYRLIPGLKNQLFLFDRKIFSLILSYGSGIVLASACLTANSAGLRWLMNWLVSPTFVTFMVVLLTPSILLSQVVGPLAITIMPATSAYEATGRQEMLQKLLSQGVKYITFLVLVALIVVFFLLKPLLNMWMGSEYLFLTPYAVMVFASMCFRESTSVAHHMLKGLGKLNVVVKIYFFSLVLLPSVMIITIMEVYDNPYIAITAGLSTGYIFCGIMQLLVCAKYTNVRITDIIVRGYLFTISIAMGVCGGITFILRTWNDSGLIKACSACLAAVIIFISAWYFFVVTDNDRIFINRLFLKIRCRLSII